MLFLVLVFFIPFIFKRRIVENLDNPGTYVLPPLPEECKTDSPCVFENGQRLEGCPGGMTNEYVCKYAQTQEKRRQAGFNDNTYWPACPYQCFGDGCKGNWRWNAQVDQETKDVTRCTPPADGTPGYQQPDVKMGPEYYLPNARKVKPDARVQPEMTPSEEEMRRPSMVQPEMMPVAEETRGPSRVQPEMMPDVELPEEEVPFPRIINVNPNEVIPRFAPYTQEEEEQRQIPMVEEERRRMVVMEEESMIPKKVKKDKVEKPLLKQYHDKKQDQIKKMMDDQNQSLNTTMDSQNPVNINVSYNNNRPISYNNYDDNANGSIDLSKYLFDSGYSTK
jgi:hypothetical protein